MHTREIPLAPDVDVEALAAASVGMVGADLANLANEARCSRHAAGTSRRRCATSRDALEKIELGTRASCCWTEADKRRTAYHEAGHA